MALRRIRPLSAVGLVACFVLQGASGCFFPEFQAAQGNSGGEGGGGGATTVGVGGMNTGGGGNGPLVVPEGWEGPYLIVEDSLPDPLCPPSFMSVGSGQAGLTNEPPDCSDCGCAAGGACGNAVVQFHTNTTCTAPAFVGTAVPGQCNSFSAPATAMSAIIQSGADSGTSCTPDPLGGQVEGMPEAFQTYINLCEAPANCDDFSCVEPTPSKVCITTDGSEECPVGFQDELAKVFFAGVDDQRACGTCNCEAPSCLYGTSLFLNSGCQFVPKPISNVCSSVTVAGTPLTVALSTPSEAAAPTCTPMTGGATLTVNVSDPFTVCCRANE